MPIRSRVVALVLAASLTVIAPLAPGQNGARGAAQGAARGGAKALTIDDYGAWNRVGSVSLSADGEWMAYTINPNEGDPTLTLRQIEGRGRHEIKNGASARFSADGRHAVYLIGPGDGERGGERGNEVVAVLLDLESGETAEYPGVQSAEFSGDGLHLLILKSRPAPAGGDGGPRGEGAPIGRDALLIGLDDRGGGGVGDRRALHLGDVGEVEFNDEEPEFLAYTVDTKDGAGNGVYLLDLDGRALVPLATSSDRYAGLSWHEDGERLAVLRGTTPKGKANRENGLLAFDAGDPAEPVLEFDMAKAAARAGVDAAMVLSERGGVSWSDDGELLFVGLDHQEARVEADRERANVDVWHWRDERPQSVQEVQAGRDRAFTYTASIVVESGELVTLADERVRSVQVLGGGRWGLGRDDSAYRGEVAWGGSRADYVRVDLTTGDRDPIARSIGRPIGTSPDGRWFVYLEGERVMAHDLDRDRGYDLTRATGIDFVDRDDDHPYELPAYGLGGWVAGEGGGAESIILNHRFDLYRVALDGSGHENLTDSFGEDEQIRFRVVELDAEAEYVDLDAPVLLSAYGEWTKESGFFALRPGRESGRGRGRGDAGGAPRELIFDDARFGRPIKAEGADRVLVTRETFEEFPDYHATDTSFSTLERMTEANPQLSEYAWGRRVLIDYENGDGVPLQATLALPAGYEPGERYPMIVYFYEKMSQRHHEFSLPVFDDRVHMSTYASNGYLVLMPDVVYKTGRPGDCAVDCVTSAVREVISRGYADPERVGLQGHSWGGYQSSFILTQTDMFAAIVTGAPVTNLVSFYNELYKQTGTIQHGIVEIGQVRMGTNPFEDFARFVDQSPVHNAEGITTPFVILHGTADGAVDWHQGLELYASARRLGKPAVLLSYPDEPHHLRVKSNQIDFQIRMKQFFDHYLKGEPAPTWWTQGVPYLRKDREGPRGEPVTTAKPRGAAGEAGGRSVGAPAGNRGRPGTGG